MSPEDRAKAVVAHFPGVPASIRPELEHIIARAIHRAINQELAKLERLAASAESSAYGRGKGAKGYDQSAIHWHRYWKERFREMRAGPDTSESE